MSKTLLLIMTAIALAIMVSAVWEALDKEPEGHCPTHAADCEQ